MLMPTIIFGQPLVAELHYQSSHKSVGPIVKIDTNPESTGDARTHALKEHEQQSGGKHNQTW